MDFYSISLSNVTPVKLVTAKATYGIGFLTAFVGGFCSLFGIPNNMFTQKLKKAETLAMEELTVNAKAVGADGVMDVRCQIDGLSFLVCGTAYKWSPAERAKREAEEKSIRINTEIIAQSANHNPAEKSTYNTECKTTEQPKNKAEEMITTNISIENHSDDTTWVCGKCNTRNLLSNNTCWRCNNPK